MMVRSRRGGQTRWELKDWSWSCQENMHMSSLLSLATDEPSGSSSAVSARDSRSGRSSIGHDHTRGVRRKCRYQAPSRGPVSLAASPGRSGCDGGARRRQMKSISPHTCLLGAGRRGARGRQDVSAKTRAAKTRSAGGGRGAGETPEDDEDDRGTWMYSGRCRHHAWGCAEPSGQDWVGQAD